MRDCISAGRPSDQIGAWIGCRSVVLASEDAAQAWEVADLLPTGTVSHHAGHVGRGVGAGHTGSGDSRFVEEVKVRWSDRVSDLDPRTP